MLTLKFSEQEIKEFMRKLFREAVFDNFETRGIEINTFTKFEISGVLDKSFEEAGNNPEEGNFTGEEGAFAETRSYYCSWGQIKPYVLNIIKGNKSPKGIKIIFSYKNANEFNENAKALFLNINFDVNHVMCTTGTSQVNFTLDRALDTLWNDYIIDMFNKINIPYENITV